MALNWTQLGDVASVTQLTGLDAVKLISLIVKSANNARMHKKNCRKFAQHLKLIGNLLEQLKLSELKERPETREPLEELEDALRKAYLLVQSCQNRSYLYLLALGWHIVNQFKDSQQEIDSLLRLIPLITLVDNNRERLRVIEKDQQEYTLDEEEKTIQNTIFKTERTENDAAVLQQSLARSYPGLPFNEALKKEKEKLRMELQYMQECMELDQCDVIQHLIYVTESANAISRRRKSVKEFEDKPREDEDTVVNQESVDDADKHEHSHQDVTSYEDSDLASYEYVQTPRHNVSIHHSQEFEPGINSESFEKWHNRLYHCYRDPYLCIATFMYPCGTFANITAVVTDGKVSQEEACNNYLVFSLFLTCYCYTCCVRRKLRKRFGISGGSCDDFCAHMLCFSCALIQERREIIAREGQSSHSTKMTPPQDQSMDR